MSEGILDVLMGKAPVNTSGCFFARFFDTLDESFRVWLLLAITHRISKSSTG